MRGTWRLFGEPTPRKKRLDTLTAQVDVVHRRVLDRDAKFAVIEARLALAEADLPAPVVQRVVRRKAAG